MKTGPAIARGKSKQDYPTPWEFIWACEHRFCPISFDLAASPENAKAPKFYTIEDDSLSKPWHELDGVLWLNPPFDNIAPWAKKCEQEARLGAQILLLTPASVGANWFKNFVHRTALVLALNGRIQFMGASDPYPKDCILSVFGIEPCAGFDVWTWPDDVPDMQNPENY